MIDIRPPEPHTPLRPKPFSPETPLARQRSYCNVLRELVFLCRTVWVIQVIT